MKRVIRNYVSEPSSCLPPPSIPPLTEVNLTGVGRLTGRGTKSVILNSFQDLSFPQSIPHPTPLLLRRGNSIIVRSTVTDYSPFTFLSLFTHLFAPSPVLRTPSPNREREIKPTSQSVERILMQTSCLPIEI